MKAPVVQAAAEPPAPIAPTTMMDRTAMRVLKLSKLLSQEEEQTTALFGVMYVYFCISLVSIGRV